MIHYLHELTITLGYKVFCIKAAQSHLFSLMN